MLGESATAPLAEVQAGTTLGKYELIERIAVGGMAEIFLARASGMLGFHRLAVIKRILPHLAARGDFIEMFLDEARIAVSLQHPNVVQTYEVGVAGNSFFTVMEHVLGEDLLTIARAVEMRNERVPLGHALKLIADVAAGLHYAHEQVDHAGQPLEIVHRDVTPHNVMVSYQGGVKLLDFGIAKAANRLGETRDGGVKGKLPYMSPEQCRGEPLDRRSDVFSLGILLYEITLGRRLFTGSADYQILHAIVEGEVLPPREVEPDYDPELEAIVMKALAPARERRFATARQLQAALEELMAARRLGVSALSLESFMQRVFAERLGRWQAALSTGTGLAAHVRAEAAERADRLASEERRAQDRGAALVRPLTGRTAHRPRVSRRGLALGAAVVLGVAVTLAAVGVGRSRSSRIGESARTAKVESEPPRATVASLPAPAIAGTPSSARSGSVRIDTRPAGATVVFDGARLEQRTPTLLGDVRPGAEHSVVVELAGYHAVGQRMAVEPGEQAELAIRLRRDRTRKHPAATHPAAVERPTAAAVRPAAAVEARPAPPQTGPGRLVLATSPWCRVVIDGRDRGTTPLSLALPAGTHQVVLSNPEFHISRQIELTIEANQTLRKTLEFALDDR